MKGKVAVFVPRSKEDLLKAQTKLFEEIEREKGNFENNPGTEVSQVEEILFHNKDRPGMYFQGKLCLYERVAVLQPGDYFGETCNLNNNIRNASLFALEDVHLLWMHGKDYLKYFNRSIEEFLIKQRIIAEIFPDFTSATVKNISLYFKPWEFPSGRVIYDEGDQCNFLGYLTDGGIEVATSSRKMK